MRNDLKSCESLSLVLAANDAKYEIRASTGQFLMPQSVQSDVAQLERVLTKAFMFQPILGDVNLSQNEKKILHEIADAAITLSRANNSDSQNDLYSDIIVLATVLLLRNWNDENGENMGFWEYVFNQYALPFNDRNFGNSIEYKIFKNSIKKSFSRHKKFMASSGHKYYTTMLTHALAPKSKFFDLFEQIFAFYAKTLRYHYIKHDPAFRSFARVMKQRFEHGSSRSDDDVYVKSVQSSSAIKALFQYCYEDMCGIVEHIIYNIDMIIDKGHIQVNSYFDELLSDWYHLRNRDVRSKDKQERVKESKERVVTEFSNIRPLYRFESGRVMLFIPSIRLGEDIGTDPWITIYRYENDDAPCSTKMSCYGNYICVTSNKFEVPIESLIAGNSRKIELRVVISHGGKDIYDSGTKLYRNAIAFDKEGSEISKRPSDKYITLYLPQCATINGEDTTTDSRERSNNGFLYRILIDDKKHIAVNRTILFPVVKEISGLTINKSVAPLDFCKYLIENHEYDIYTKCPTLTFSSTEPNFDKMFRVEVNGESFSIAQCFDDVQNLYCITLPGGARTHHLQIVGNTTQDIIYSLPYVVIEDISICFQGFYFFEDWKQNGTVEITESGKVERYPYMLPPNEDVMVITYGDGELLIDIPRLYCCIDGYEMPANSERIFWHEDISMSSLLEVSIPRGYSGRTFIGSVPYDSKKIEIGNEIRAKQNQEEETVGIVLRSPEESFVEIKLFDIAFEPYFKSTPIVEERDALIWYAGDNFIGNHKSVFDISIIHKGNEVGRYKLNSSDDEAVLDKHFSNGAYSFTVNMKAPGLFSEFEELYFGEFFVGDPAQYRFEDKAIIVTSAITDNYKHLLNHASGIVTHIKYLGELPLNGEAQPYPCYEGRLAFKHEGELIPYATKHFIDRKGREREQINPVKIWVINEYTLSLRSPTDDGLYIHKSWNSITDRTPHNAKPGETDYCNADYYSYKSIPITEVKNV